MLLRHGRKVTRFLAPLLYWVMVALRGAIFVYYELRYPSLVSSGTFPKPDRDFTRLFSETFF